MSKVQEKMTKKSGGKKEKGKQQQVKIKKTIVATDMENQSSSSHSTEQGGWCHDQKLSLQTVNEETQNCSKRNMQTYVATNPKIDKLHLQKNKTSDRVVSRRRGAKN